MLYNHDFKTILYRVMTQISQVLYLYVEIFFSLPSFPLPSTHWGPIKGSPSRGSETRSASALSGCGRPRRGAFIVREDTVVTVTPAHHTPCLETTAAVVRLTLQEYIKSSLHCLNGPPLCMHNVLQLQL